MAHKAHVPKFGDWESEDISYTVCFDNARAMKINPNDPEESPEAFMAMMKQARARKSNQNSISRASSTTHSTRDRLGRAKLYRSTSSSDKYQHADRGQLSRHQHKAKSQTSSEDNTKPGFTMSKSGTERTSSDNISSSSARGLCVDSSSSRPGNRHRRVHGHGSSTNHSSNHDRGHHHRTASIPEFGSWDVNDPKSGDGFTTIFDKEKEENQVNSSASYKVQIMPPPSSLPSSHLKDQTRRKKYSRRSKICCCLFSRGSD